jgi:hypothetical protein
MLSELGHELWMRDEAKIRAAVVRQQKTDARDATHLLDMVCTERFPKIWRNCCGTGEVGVDAGRSEEPDACAGHGAREFFQKVEPDCPPRGTFFACRWELKRLRAVVH